MPYARKRRPRTYRRRSYFNRYRKGSRYYKSRLSGRTRYSKKRITSLGRAFPRSVYQKMLYADIFDLSCGATDKAERFFRPSDIYDVDYTGVGGQPTPFATMVAMYKKWHVKAYKYSMRVINTCNQSVIVGCIDSGEDFTFPVNGTQVQQELLENNNGKYIILNPTGTPGHSGTITRYINPKTLIGDEYKDHDYRGTGSANPTHWTFNQLVLANLDGTTTGATCRVVVRFTFYVHWSERILPVQD